MNWLTFTVLGAVAAWFEYNYQRSRRKKAVKSASAEGPDLVPETAHVEQLGGEPSIAPGSENDKKLNSAV